jgi:hypothetical protein
VTAFCDFCGEACERGVDVSVIVLHFGGEPGPQPNFGKTACRLECASSALEAMTADAVTSRRALEAMTARQLQEARDDLARFKGALAPRAGATVSAVVLYDGARSMFRELAAGLRRIGGAFGKGSAESVVTEAAARTLQALAEAKGQDLLFAVGGEDSPRPAGDA